MPKDLGTDNWFPMEVAEVLKCVPVAFTGVQKACRLMHHASPRGNDSNRPLFLMSNFCHLHDLFAHYSLRNGTGFVAPEFIDSDFPRHGIPPGKVRSPYVRHAR